MQCHIICSVADSGFYKARGEIMTMPPNARHEAPPLTLGNSSRVIQVSKMQPSGRICFSEYQLKKTWMYSQFQNEDIGKTVLLLKQCTGDISSGHNKNTVKSVQSQVQNCIKMHCVHNTIKFIKQNKNTICTTKESKLNVGREKEIPNLINIFDHTTILSGHPVWESLPKRAHCWGDCRALQFIF